jgi:hypothetical protein
MIVFIIKATMISETTNNSIKFALFALLLMIGGGISDYYGSSYPLISKSISVLENDKIVIHDIMETPLCTQFLRILSMILYSLGTSIFISVFFIYKLERNRFHDLEKQSEKISNTINQDVFDAVFNRLMPPEVFKAMKDSIIHAKMIRRNAQWIYDFTIIGSSCTIKQTIIYDLENSGADEMREPIVAELDDDNGKDKLVRAVCEVDGQNISHYDPDNGKEDAVKIEKDPTGGKTKITINSIIPSRKTAKFTFVYQINRDVGHIEDIYFSKYSIIDGLITANFPREFEFNLWLSASATKKIQLEEPERTIIQISGCILPHQGYQYSLRKRKKFTIN